MLPGFKWYNPVGITTVEKAHFIGLGWAFFVGDWQCAV